MKTAKRFIFLLSLAMVLLAPLPLYSEEVTSEVFLLEKGDKLMAFSGPRSSWFIKDLRSGESVIKSAYDGNVAIAYTNERALAFSVITSRWTEKRFRIRESVESISVDGNVGTVITDIRALGFSAQSGTWIETLFKID